MSHDLLCNCAGHCVTNWRNCPCGQMHCGCLCNFIAKVRADERQKATGGLIDQETAARIAASALTAGCVMPRVITEPTPHDPMCLLPSSCEQYPDGHPRAKRFYCDDCEIDCECERIAAIRADEREQAAQRIETIEPTWAWSNVVEGHRLTMQIVALAVAAARGES